MIGETAFERMLALRESRENFLMEFNNYMQGVIVNTPKMFLMAKPVDSSKRTLTRSGGLRNPTHGMCDGQAARAR